MRHVSTQSPLPEKNPSFPCLGDFLVACLDVLASESNEIEN